MTKPSGAAAYAAIEAAMGRLLARIDGPATLTIARLASEAGVSRATLYRAPELLDRFRAALEQRNPDNRTAPNSDRIGELGAEIATSRGRESDEIRDLRRSAVTMALSLLVAPSSEPMPSTVESAAAMDYVLVPAIECKSNGDRS